MAKIFLSGFSHPGRAEADVILMNNRECLETDDMLS
jgi:hypothetical protein